MKLRIYKSLSIPYSTDQLKKSIVKTNYKSVSKLISGLNRSKGRNSRGSMIRLLSSNYNNIF